ncbi:MAG: DUF2344 domain-containing protein [Deltaproteobacteria bacterium]|nr:DUF2344 domain-containing protein [Deltaproteobacteria bacterium]
MSAAPERYRYRLRFAKTGAMRWIGHLDLQKNIERMLRRARVPLWHSQGYHPRPRLIFASALPLGQTSKVELLDLWLSEELEAGELLSRLQRVAHPDLSLFDASPRPAREPTITMLLSSACYRAQLLKDEDSDQCAVDANTLQARVEALLATEELLRERRRKTYNLRPLIEALEVEASGDALTMQLATREGQHGRAEEVLLALELDPAECRVERTALLLDEPTNVERLNVDGGAPSPASGDTLEE